MYRVRLAKQAERGLRRIRQGDPRGYERLKSSIRSLAEEPLPTGAAKLTDFDPPAWRIRVGGYRIVYEIHDDELLVVVVNVAPRGEVYR
ncbi:MAG: type II toxin-antitoxin system RelE/ParE family toxin [Actinomycetota bacterium]|nr:type II toxin-antitoxin system RelE/ParE family toxin [Actinomycetota bacterium]